MNMNFSKVSRNVKRIYKESDVKMKQIASVCSKGCNYCCYQPIWIHLSESILIIKYLEESFSREQLSEFKTKLEEWFAYFNKNTPSTKQISYVDVDQFTEIMTKDGVPCLFLHNNECAIYSVRPLACRFHTVNDNPDTCKINPLRKGDIDSFNIRNDAYKEICKVADLCFQQLLQYTLTDFFKITNYEKNIASEALLTLK